MPKKFIFYSDLHIGAPNEIKVKLKLTKNTVFLGDNFDIKNSKIYELEKIKSIREKIRKTLLKKEGIYLSGNHSRQSKDIYCKRGKILFTHGDLVHYGEEKTMVI